MKKIFVLLSLMLFLNGCAESVALLGTSVGGVSSGKMAQSSVQSAASYGIKKTTGKSPIGHAIAFAKDKNSEQKTKENCKYFITKTNLEICALVKKQMSLTKAKLEKKESSEETSKEFASSIQPTIDKKFSIEYLDR